MFDIDDTVRQNAGNSDCNYCCRHHVITSPNTSCLHHQKVGISRMTN